MVKKILMLVMLSGLVSISANGATGSAQFEGLSCSGEWLNDAMAAHCQSLGVEARIHDVGTRYQYHSFETISKNLSAKLESDYDMILLINSAEGNTPNGAFVPNQHMLVVAKKPGQKKMFTRDSKGVINGLAKGVYQVSDIVGDNVINKVAGTGKGYGTPILWDGMEMTPVSTGASWHMLSFSGIFQVNWGRSVSNWATSYGAPMSNQFYFGYFYHSRGTPISKWTDDRRERVSYAAVHGTPKSNWKLLGKERASHGCTRVHPYIQEGLRNHANNLSLKNVVELDWDYVLPVQDVKTPIAPRKPILIMSFDSYDTVGI